MSTRALVLVHDPAEGRRHRIPGALVPALATRGIGHDVASFVDGADPELGGHDLVVVMGSQESVYDRTVPWIARELAFVTSVIRRGVPVLGICFGGQLLARALGGTVARAARPEIGFTEVDSDRPDLVPAGPWMQFHADAFVPPPTATEIARNAHSSQAFVAGKVLAVQFHPEITPDAFDSWVERWAADGGASGNGVRERELDALREAVARNERRSTGLCERLVGAFCAQHL